MFGAAFDENFKVVHKSVQSLDQLHDLLGSKYVQSDIGNTYSEAKNFLQQGRLVLFSGVPCQLAGLYSFLGKNLSASDNLVRVDLFCMGSPSPGIWREYVEYMKGKHCRLGALEQVTFRDYEGGDWRGKPFKFKFKFKFKCKNGNLDPYFRSFLECYTLRPSCYECSFKAISRYWSDITLGDFWGIENVLLDFVNDSGTSAVLVHGERGEKVFENIKKSLVYREAQASPSFNGGLVNKSKPSNYEKFWVDYEKHGIVKAAHRNVYEVRAIARLLTGMILRKLGMLDMVKSLLKRLEGVPHGK